MLALVHDSVVVGLSHAALAANLAYGAICAEHGKLVGPWPTPAEAALDEAASDHKSHVQLLSAVPAVTLAGCQAKARVLRTCPENEALLLSLLDDLESLS